MKKFLQSFVNDFAPALQTHGRIASVKRPARRSRRKLGKFEQLEKRLVFAAELLPQFESLTSVQSSDPVVASVTNAQGAIQPVASQTVGR